MSSNSLLPDQSSVRITLGIVPTWWDGESLYGWCSRLHTLEVRSVKSLGTILFGRAHACRNVDIPVGMDRFVAATAGRLGGVEDILRTRTVTAAYWPFAEALTRSNLIDAVTDVNGASAAQVLGLLASRVGADHPLRSCPACRSEQQHELGCATWLLNQQLPGVWWCARHHQPLEQVGLRRQVWFKPGQEDVKLSFPHFQAEAQDLAMMAALAERITTIDEVRPACLSGACIRRLRDIGHAPTAARLNTRRVSEWVESRPLLQWIRRQGDAIIFPRGNWVVPMIRGRSRGHPLKWLVLWTCLWGGEPASRVTQAFEEAARGQVAIEEGDQFLLWPEEGKRVRVALPDAVENAFHTCDTMAEVMAKLGVSLLTVRRWMQEHPEFVAAWRKRVHDGKLAGAVRRMNDAIDARPMISRAQLLRQCAQEAAWLNDHSPVNVRRILDRLPRMRGPQGELFGV